MNTAKCFNCGKMITFSPSQKRKYCSFDCYKKTGLKNRFFQSKEKNKQYNTNISKEQILDLYQTKNYGIFSVAKILGVTRSMVRKRLKSYGISIRNYDNQMKIAREKGIKVIGLAGDKNPAYKHGKMIGQKANRKIYFSKAKINLKWECDICETKKTTPNFDLIIHHKDNNNKNNDLLNLRVLCQACHTKIHVAQKKYGFGVKGIGLNLIKINKIEKTQLQVNMYDLEVEGNHNFILSNNILTHNSGKTMLIRHFCHKNKIPYYRIVMNGGTTVEDIVGQNIMDESGKLKFEYQVLLKFMQKGGIIVFDEINAGQKDILHILNSITDFERKAIVTQHKGEVIQAVDNFLVVACMNPPAEYDLAEMSKSLKSRFCPYYFNYDDKVDKQVLGNDEKLMNFARAIRTARLDTHKQIDTPLSTRDLKQYQLLKEGLGSEVAKEMLVNKFHNGEKQVVRTMIETHLEKSNILNKDKEKVDGA